MLIFDIETAPLSDDQLRQLWVPPELPERPGEFDPSSVRVGNLKDRAKIAEKIENARHEHEVNCATYDDQCALALEESFSAFKANAPLDAVTGYVLAIGYLNPDTKIIVIDSGNEHEILHRFWEKAVQCRNQHRSIIGLNIHDFDLPFLIRRSWICDISVPNWTIRQHRFFDDVFIDLRKVWLCGQYGAGSGIKSNFNHLGRAFMTGGKPDGIDGSQFWQLWESDKEKACEYLRNDLRQPAIWAERMGIL